MIRTVLTRSIKNVRMPVTMMPITMIPVTMMSTNIIHTSKMTTQQNMDDDYIEVGIVYYTDTQGINAIRQIGTSVVNMFGGKGFDTSVYDNLRTESLQNVLNLLENDNKLCNVRMEFCHADQELIVHHIYGTLLKKINN